MSKEKEQLLGQALKQNPLTEKQLKQINEILEFLEKNPHLVDGIPGGDLSYIKKREK